ncbi:hypothetical protein DSM112329_01803 [Paraconexibacter sp. AEG42_29]|uniref:RDD domain-containing protein n=1 Tax=Paraconexibacter sp. AEG42_29 TaxID=2997339 RepID=A0AAU7ATD7_9ACTN
MNEKAGWWPRAGAMLIDALILTAIALAVGITMSGAGASTDDATIAIYVVVFLASVTYSPLLMARKGDANGQTVGKQALGIRVVHSEGGEMTVPRGLLRDGLGKSVLGIIPFYTFVDVLVPLFDAEKQALHDKLGKTFVVPAATLPHSLGAATGDAPPAHPAWSAPPTYPRSGAPLPPAPNNVPPPPPPPSRSPSPPPPSFDKSPGPSLDKSPSPPPSFQKPSPPPSPAGPPDLGGFAPPSAPPPARPREDEDEDTRGPFGPWYDDD